MSKNDHNYLVVLSDVEHIETSVLVKGNDELAELLELIAEDNYAVLDIQTLGRVRAYEDLISELKSLDDDMVTGHTSEPNYEGEEF